MKNFVVVCLAVLVTVSAAAPAYSRREEVSPFAPARRIGDPPARTFYLFSTSVGNYTIRHDGMGEVFVRGRKKVFHVKVGFNSRIERLYFFEYGDDLLLLYEAGASGYLVRLDQKSKKIKKATAIDKNFEPPQVNEQSVTFIDGTVVPLD